MGAAVEGRTLVLSVAKEKRGIKKRKSAIILV